MEEMDELDHVPLMQRRRFLLAGDAEKRSSFECGVEDVNSAASQKWPNLPRGTKFDPTDGDLLWHLIAKNEDFANKTSLQHPFIHEFIKSLDGDRGFDMHPQNLSGVKQDGSISYFFHKPLNEHNCATCQHPIGWKKTGKTKPVFLDGTHQGFKKVYNLYNPEKTNWVLCQYHAGTEVKKNELERENEIVVSKVFFSLKSKKNLSLKHDDPSETCTQVEAEDPNQGQNGNFGQIAIKTEPVSDTSALHVAHSDSSFLDTCIVKSELIEDKVPLNIKAPLLGSYSQSSEKVNNGAGYKSLKKRKRKKKTATDSAEEALEEDAPELLKVLNDKGIIMGEIKLYGVGEDDTEPLDTSSENDFENLENVITKLFPDRASLLKITNAKDLKAAKAAYCLASLISLIEQTQYLQFRKSPVEWGWCRDLQSFIFVFKTHNRIVLERPEYGYATYFFELIQSMPIDWQIKRLVIAMKVNNSRACLIENKPLLVGDDLTEGEACILEDYGWVRNTGIGTMLNYCDRVVHDRYHESDTSEWRVKICRILMNGYNRGSVVLTEVPNNVRKYLNEEDLTLSPSRVKLEYQCELEGL